MKKLLTLLASILLCSFASCVQDEGRLIILTSADNPPYEFTSSGAIIGFDVDLVKIIAARLGKSYEIKDITFSSIIPSLHAMQADMAIAAITPTDLRRQNLDFSVPYQANTSALVVVKVRDFNNVKEGAYFPVELLKGRTLGVQIGTHHESDVKGADIDGVIIRRYDTVNNLVAEMMKSASGTGILYGIIIGVPEARAIVGKNSKLTFYRLKFEDSFAIAFPKGSPLRDDVNRIIDDLVAEGKISELESKWDISK
ncbi:MAG: transporter substrate-binding domain-containing protein [Puniceicoccales bacterium]|jgi:polar amino acid transport system substrate-binding protein|nr:transporter substrate-binding domain-containing protein [Puniceicoccales bacterium]